MKKIIVAALAVLAFGTSSMAQNGNPPIEVLAKQAAQAAGCLDDYHGPLDYQTTVVSSCFAGGFVTEVIIAPQCTGPNCDGVRLAPLAIVTFYCDENPANAQVTCF